MVVGFFISRFCVFSPPHRSKVRDFEEFLMKLHILEIDFPTVAEWEHVFISLSPTHRGSLPILAQCEDEMLSYVVPSRSQRGNVNLG